MGNDQTASVTTRRRQETRDRLMAAAREVFAEVGLDGVSVEAICERAGFTRGAFYSNFDSKEELFLDLAASVTRRQLALMTQRVQDLRDAHVTSEAHPPSGIPPIAQMLFEGERDARLDVVLMSELRLRAMRDEATARAYREWEKNVTDRVRMIVESLAQTYGLRLRVPIEDFARFLIDAWGASATTGVIDRVGDEQAWIRSCAHVEQLATALVDAPEP